MTFTHFKAWSMLVEYLPIMYKTMVSIPSAIIIILHTLTNVRLWLCQVTL